MIRNIAILVVLVALIAGYTWYDNHCTSPASPTLPASGDETTSEQSAPDFSFTDLSGATHRLSDFRGKVVVLNFWATWCAPCVIEFPQMIALAESTRGKAVFLFLSQDDDREAIERFTKKHAPKVPDNVFIAQDTGLEVAQKLYQTYKLPETYLITRDGRIAEKIIGADVEWNGTAMQEKIGSLAQ